MTSAAEEITLPSPPFDSISKVRYSPNDPDLLLVSSWDTTVRLYEVGDETRGKVSDQRVKFDHRAAILDCCWEDDGRKVFCGGLDAGVRYMDLASEKSTALGSHSDTVSSLSYSTTLHSLISASWDRTIKLWDPRAASPNISTINLPERVYAIDLAEKSGKLVVAMASRLFHVYDIRNMAKGPEQERESSLKYMTRSVSCMVDGQGYSTASVEGRIAVEYFDASKETQTKKYAFKCHRETVDGVDHVWPVNSMTFHPIHNTFASAGSDGTVSIWDHVTKKRLRQYPRYNAPVASVGFNCDGTKLAVALSYTWDQGEPGSKKVDYAPSVKVRRVGEEVKPKPKA